MKNAAKKWYNYLIALFIDAILALSATLPNIIGGDVIWPKKYCCYFLLFAGVVVIGIGFIIQDIYRGVIRHRINDWNNNLDIKYINKAWSIFYPLLISGGISIIVGIISNFFIK